jgi:uncharacterized protein YbjT (DUF2867 family)
MPHHWAKLRVEEALFESELGYTILQPAAYMQNVLAGWTAIAERGEHRVPYSVDTRLGMVDLEDVAEAAGIVLTDSQHVGATYELAGSEVLSQTEVAAVLSRVFGRPVRAKTIATGRWLERARASGMDAYRVRTLVKMFEYYDHYGFWGNPGVLTWLLGRTPRRFEEFVRRTLDLSSS